MLTGTYKTRSFFIWCWHVYKSYACSTLHLEAAARESPNTARHELNALKKGCSEHCFVLFRIGTLQDVM